MELQQFAAAARLSTIVARGEPLAVSAEPKIKKPTFLTWTDGGSVAAVAGVTMARALPPDAPMDAIGIGVLTYVFLEGFAPSH